MGKPPSPYKNLPPTPRLMGAVDRVALLSEEVLALRILLACTVWKAGGTVKVSEAEITYVAKNCQMDAAPTTDGQILTVLTPGIQDTPTPSTLILPGN